MLKSIQAKSFVKGPRESVWHHITTGVLLQSGESGHLEAKGGQDTKLNSSCGKKYFYCFNSPLPLGWRSIMKFSLF